MKLTTSILTVTAAMMTSGAWAQNPNIINNVQSSMNTVQAQKTSDSNAALGITGKPAAAQPAKPAGAAPPPSLLHLSLPNRLRLRRRNRQRQRQRSQRRRRQQQRSRRRLPLPLRARVRS